MNEEKLANRAMIKPIHALGGALVLVIVGALSVLLFGSKGVAAIQTSLKWGADLVALAVSLAGLLVSGKGTWTMLTAEKGERDDFLRGAIAAAGGLGGVLVGTSLVSGRSEDPAIAIASLSIVGLTGITAMVCARFGK